MRQLADRQARLDAADAAGKVFKPALGRTGEDNVPRVGIEEHVLDSDESRQVLHLGGGRFPLGEAGLDGRLQAVERDLAEGALPGDLLLQIGLGGGDPLPGQPIPRVGECPIAEHALGVHGNASLLPACLGENQRRG